MDTKLIIEYKFDKVRKKANLLFTCITYISTTSFNILTRASSKSYS